MPLTLLKWNNLLAEWCHGLAKILGLGQKIQSELPLPLWAILSELVLPFSSA